jgi:hypothetical protein
MVPPIRAIGSDVGVDSDTSNSYHLSPRMSI